MLNQIFMEKQELQVQRATTEEGKTQQDIYIQEIAKTKQKKKYDFVARSTTFIVKEENLFQKFAKLIIETAKKAGKKNLPNPVYEEWDVQMPNSVRTTQILKELNKTSDIQQSKKSLGFTW